MNKALLLANAIALATLLGAHPEKDSDLMAQRTPHYLQIQKAPQWAMLSNQQGLIGRDQDMKPLPPSSDRLVF